MAGISAITIGILTALIMAIVLYKPQTLLQKRFNKTSENAKVIKNISSDISDILRPISQYNINKKERNKTKNLLVRAGLPSSDEDVIRCESKKIAMALFGILVSLLLLINDFSSKMAIFGVIFTYFCYITPTSKLKQAIKKREQEFMKFLPDAIDLIAICVKAGLGLDAAFAKVAEEFSFTSKAISNDFDRLNKDILTGIDRQDAYKNLVAKNNNADLQSFVALLLQSDKLGTSISQSLEAFCDTLRTKKRQRVEEFSQKASTKMTIPMVLFMLPAIFIIIMFPAIQKLMENLK